jgi:hypothetical protein
VSFVYYIHAPAIEAVKIGWSADPASRIRRLSEIHHCSMSLLAAVPGSRGADEGRHQAEWAHLWLSGEWFVDCPTLLAHARATRSVLRPFSRAHGSRREPIRPGVANGRRSHGSRRWQYAWQEGG